MAEATQIERVDVSKLIPYINNAKQHSEQQVAKLAASIREFGFVNPVLIDKDFNVIAGHGRIMAAKKLGLSEVPCLFIEGLSEAQRKAYILADNRLGELAEWDMELVTSELEALQEMNFDIDLTGFELEQEDGVREDDYDPVLPKEPRAKLGDVYQLGRHRLMCGDATSAEDVKTLVDKEIDVFLTDPPYNVDYEGTAGKIKNDKMEDDKFRLFLTEAFTNAKSVMKNGGAFHIWHADSEGYNFRGACIDAGLKVRQCLIWEKNSLVLGRQDFQWIHEPCLYGENPPPEFELEEYTDEFNDVSLYGWKDGGRHYWFKNRKQTTILHFDRPAASKEHPTMKPIRLFDYQMQCNSKPGENVLDLFAGSGTTIMAAEQNGRNAYCMEFDPKYVDVIIDRWESFTGKKAVLIS